MKTKQDVIQWIENNRAQFVDMAEAIWHKPELAFKEFFASGLQSDFLEEAGFHVTRDIAGINTAFIAEWGEGKPIIAFAGEYDALPGLSQKIQTEQEPLTAGACGHGCGHNLLGTAHVASAMAVKNWMQANDIKGTVRYYGCPAEEAGSAKTYMAREGLFDDLDAAFNFHPMYVNAPMKGSWVGTYSCKFRFHGITSHAGAAPHLGRSALDAVELLNVGLNYLREHVTTDVRMHYVITQGGLVPNVVPDLAEGHYLLRAHHANYLREVVDRVRKIAEGAALMTGTTVEEIFESATSNVLNNSRLADIQYENLKVIGPIQWSDEEIAFAERVNAKYPEGTATANANAFNMELSTLTAPILGANFPAMDEGKLITASTDVGDLSWKTPLSMLTTACWTTASPAHSWGVVATSGMSIGHKGMLHAAKAMALSAMDLFTDPEKLKNVQDEFADKVKNSPYICPIPEGVEPPRYTPEGE